MTTVVVGGSSGLGRAICEELAARGRDVVVVASNVADCTRLADHLRLLYGVNSWPLALEAREPAMFGEGLARGLASAGPISDLFLPLGVALEDDKIGDARRSLKDIWAVNYAAIVLAIEFIRPLMAPTGGRIVGFGSIAAIRPRNRNVQYSAAKSALASYFEGLRHGLAASCLVAQFYVIGYIASGQSWGKTQLFRPLPARHAARRIVDDGSRDFGSRFLPGYWGLVAVLLRLLPWRVFSRLDF